MKTDKINLRPDKLTEKEVNFMYNHWYMWHLKNLRRCGFSSEDAEDVLQTAFMYFWEYREYYSNAFTVHTYFARQLAKAVTAFRNMESRSAKSIEVVRDNGVDTEYEFEDDESPRDLLQVVIDRLPHDLSYFLRCMMTEANTENLISAMRGKGYCISDDGKDGPSYKAWYQRSVQHIQRYHPDLYTDVRDVFFGKRTRLKPVQQARKAVRTLRTGDKVTVYRNLRNRAVLAALVEEANIHGYAVEQTEDYIMVTKVN